MLQADSLEQLASVLPEATGSDSSATLSSSSAPVPHFWLDICSPSARDLDFLAERFLIHPLTIEDIIVRDSREKCEIFETYLFLCIRTCDMGYFSFSTDKGNAAGDDLAGPSAGFGTGVPGPSMKQTSSATNGDESVNMYLLIFPTFILSIHSEPLSHVHRVLRRMIPLRQLFRVTPDWIMYALLDVIVDEFIPNIKTMELEVDSIDDLVLVLRQTDQADMLRRIGRARSQVTHMFRLLKPKTDIVKTLTKRTPDRLQSHTLLYLRDVQDHLFTTLQTLEQAGETLNRAHNNYLAQISIELAEMSNRMNLQVKKLTEITSLAIPFTVIGSLWGMNVVVPWDAAQKGQSLLPFLVLVVLSVFSAILFWMLGRKYKFF